MEMIIDLFLKQVRERSEQPSVMDLYGSYTYEQLNQRSAKLAHILLETCKQLGTDIEAAVNRGENGARIAVLLPRTRDYMVALLAVIRSGCAVVPLDSEYPVERIQNIQTDSQCLLFVTTEALSAKAGDTPRVLIESLDDIKEEDYDPALNLSKPDLEGLLVYTSGSTGKPKGVVHRQSVFSHYYTLNRMANRPLPPTDIHCCMAGFTFIAALFNLTIPIMTGALVYIANDKERQNADMLWSIIQKRHVTSMFLPPKMFMVMRELYGRLPLRNVELGGEKANPKYADDGNVFEAYASSETFCILFQRLQKEDERMLGRPAAGSRIYLIDDDGSLIEGPGKMGELCVVSPWVAIGYNNLPEETAARFTDCPFEPGTRMYHTGDYFSIDEKGNYLFRGRKDRMVKLRGYRVELGEIESVLRRAEGVEEAACVAVKVNGGDKLCCYYTGEKIDADALKTHVAAFLPTYMVPDYVVWLDTMPRNERNKVNYLALKELDLPIDEGEYAAPENESEEKVCKAFIEALHLETVSVNGDFFELGGTSLSVATMIAALGDNGYEISFQDVVHHPTPRLLASYLEKQVAERRSGSEMNREFYPLTKTQMGIYLEGITGGNSSTYTIPFLIRTAPEITAEELDAAIRKVIDAHPSMKYMIRKGPDGMPKMYPVPDEKIEIPVVDGLEEERLDFMKTFVPVVSMTDGLLFHFAIYRTSERVYLAAKTHLIFLDGTSVNLIISQLNDALSGKDVPAELYTVWQAGVREEQMMLDGTHDAAKKYYAELFKEMDELPSITGDRSGQLTPGVSDNLRYEPGTLQAARVQAFCEKNQITESSFFMGAMSILLGKYLHSKHVSFSTVYNGRAKAGMETTIGTLIKRIPVYGDLSKDLPVGDYLRGISRQIFESMSNDVYSFDEVLKECPVNEEVEFIYQGSQFTDHPDSEKVLAEGDKWFIEHYHTGMVTGYFSIQFFSTAGLYNMTIEYRNERFSPEWVKGFAEDLFAIAKSMLTCETIGQVSMLTENDKKVLRSFNDTKAEMDFVPVHEQIHAHALKEPDKKAVTAAGRTLTFRELDLLSDVVAGALIGEGIGPEKLVGVLFDREVYAYVAELGILKAGGAFVPFIPDYPDERIDFCMKDGEIQLLLTTKQQKKLHEGLLGEKYKLITLEEIFGEDDLENVAARENVSFTGPEVNPDNLAYCIYTSGTTGRPKGVMIEHRNIANYVHRNEKSPEIMYYAEPGRICLALAAFSFDVSVVEAFVPLCNGNGVVIATEEEIHTPAKLAELILNNGVTGITCTPTYLLSLLDIPETRKAFEQLTFYDIGAEAFPSQLYDRLRDIREDSIILNVFGPTEATMGCSAEVMTDNKIVTVGKPVANTYFYVADTFGNELPVGIRGELVICGDQVGRGYINLPDRSAESFFEHEGMRAYRCGDLAAWTPEGKIRIYGRIDNQIKLRGFRIELDEIEKVMTGYPGVNTGAVTVKKDGTSEYLVGYYTVCASVSEDDLKKYMQEKLPEYMIPSAFMQLDNMPVTLNGKVDKKALPAPDFSSFTAEYVAPETETEKILCHAFAEVLQIPESEFGALDDFFQRGGDSLRAMGAMSKADIEGLTPSDIFQKRTPRAIADALKERLDQGSLDEREQEARKVPHALTPLQLQMIDTQLYKPMSSMWSNTHFLVRFDKEEVEAGRLCNAVNLALQNHPALSTAFRFNDDFELVQQYVPGLLPEVKVIDIHEKAAEMLPDVLVMPFDKIIDSCLCRAGVYRSPKYTYLFMDIHHMILDGASLGVLLYDIVNAFYGRELTKDYYFALLAEEEKRISKGSRKEDHDWFKECYGDEVWCNMPKTKTKKAAINQASREKRLCFNAQQVAEAEKYWGVSHSVMAITAALMTLSKSTGKKHVMVNWIFNNRLAPEAECAVGMLIKNLPAAARMEEFDNVRDLLHSVKEQVADGIAHNTYDFMTEHYQAYLDDCMEVNLQLGINGSPLKILNPTRIPLEDIFTAAGARLELELLENEYGDGAFDSEMEYAEGLFDRKEMEEFHDLYVDILESLILKRDIIF